MNKFSCKHNKIFVELKVRFTAIYQEEKEKLDV